MITYTLHAEDRMRQRGITREQVELVIADPDQTYTRPPDLPGGLPVRVFERDEIYVSCGEHADGHVVITASHRERRQQRSRPLNP